MKAWNKYFGTDAADLRRIKSRQKAPVVKEGALDKLKGFVGVGKVWTKQYFILQSDALYFCANKDFSHASKKVCMVDVIIEFAEKKTKRQYSFAIFDREMHSLCVMAAENEQTMHDWIAALNRVRLSLQPNDLGKFNILHSTPNTLCAHEVEVSRKPMDKPPVHAIPTGTESPSTRHLTFAMVESDLPNPISIQSMPTLAPELTQIWKSVVSTSTSGISTGLDVKLHNTSCDNVQCRADGGGTRQIFAHLKIDDVSKQSYKDCSRKEDALQGQSGEYLSSGNANSKDVKSLVQMGFDCRDGAAALIECGGRLEDAVILLSRRPRQGSQ
jgi:hypothetical protein